jgi:16S rRNA (adenine1518-N6/adenine1519-N6)-dimethyltransferase
MQNSYKSILLKHNLVLKKCFGQNFIFDEEYLDKLVEKAGVSNLDTVVEIGCGAGTLTRSIAKKAKRVIGYEIDTRLKPILDDVCKEHKNVSINYLDIMKENISALEKRIGGEYIVVANLPYYITTPIIMNFLENAKNITRLVIMVQKEVAERLSATPKSKDYGAITVAINLRGSAQIIMHAGKEMFTPPPKVDSAVVRIDVDAKKFESANLKAVRNLVRCAFISRRKTLVNNLVNSLKVPRERAQNALAVIGVKEDTRGETLSAEEFVKLSEVLGEYLNG